MGNCKFFFISIKPKGNGQELVNINLSLFYFSRCSSVEKQLINFDQKSDSLSQYINPAELKKQICSLYTEQQRQKQFRVAFVGALLMMIFMPGNSLIPAYFSNTPLIGLVSISALGTLIAISCLTYAGVRQCKYHNRVRKLFQQLNTNYIPNGYEIIQQGRRLSFRAFNSNFNQKKDKQHHYQNLQKLDQTQGEKPNELQILQHIKIKGNYNLIKNNQTAPFISKGP